MNRNLTLIIAGLILACFINFGCETKHKLSAGYIDTEQLLFKWEKYKEYGNEYLKEQEKLMKKIGNGNNNLTFSDQVEIMKSKEKWDKIKSDIRNEIRSVTREVAKANRIDLVLDNPTSNPVIENGGKDITSEVLKALK